MIDTPLGAHEPPPGYLRTADLLAALSLASDLAVGLPAEHAVRSCYADLKSPFLAGHSRRVGTLRTIAACPLCMQ